MFGFVTAHAVRARLGAVTIYANKYGICLLACSSCDVGGVRFAGTTLWESDDPRACDEIDFLQCPSRYGRDAFPGADRRVRRRSALDLRNAFGYSGSAEDPRPARPDFVLEV
jgi:hypothetical protein